MKGLIGIGVVLGCLASAAQAAPEGRIECTGEPRIDGADPKGVELSTDVVGHVRVVDKVTSEDDDEAVMDVASFCEAHEGVDAFILPAPRIIDQPRSPDGEDEQLELEELQRPDSGKKVEDDEPEAEGDEGDDEVEQEPATKSMASLTGGPGAQKSFDPQMAEARGCSQTAEQRQTGWWFALLPLLLMVRVRREGGR